MAPILLGQLPIYMCSSVVSFTIHCTATESGSPDVQCHSQCPSSDTDHHKCMCTITVLLAEPKTIDIGTQYSKTFTDYLSNCDGPSQLHVSSNYKQGCIAIQCGMI